jgi:acyl carrier protein
MTQEMEFKNVVAQYCNLPADEIEDDMKFREDLGLSSLDFMSFLGELEDVFDIELAEEDALGVYTVGEALELLESM